MAGLHRVDVAPRRLAGWLDDFAARHGPPSVAVASDRLLISSPDGAEASISLIWGPVAQPDPVAELLEQVVRPRRLGALLVRRSSHAVGVFAHDELIAHTVGHHYVQGRTKAGGWSQQRYARRRRNQAERAYAKAGEAAVRLLLPALDQLDGVILGGDAMALREVLLEPDLAPLNELADRLPRRVLPVPDPSLAVLREARRQWVAVPIALNDAARSH